MEYPIIVEKLKKSFSGKEVLKGLSFFVKGGEIFGLLGPNASGKTTTIKIMVGHLLPSCGVVYILGKEPYKDMGKLAEFIGYIPDEPFFYEKLKVIEFLDFLKDLYKVDTKKIKELLEIFSLKEFENELIENLSFGSQRRLSIICGIMHQPKVLIIDEPMIGIDVLMIHYFKEILKKMKTQNCCIFLTTHILKEAEELCDRVAIIKNGNIEQEIEGEEIKDLERYFLK